MAAKSHKAKKLSMRKEAAASRLRQEWPWSQLPPIKPLIHPHNLQICRLHHVADRYTTTPAVTKSCPPPPSRCLARHRHLPRLRHLPTAKKNPNPNPNPPHHHIHFLADGASIFAAVYELPDASHWCYLRSQSEPGPKPEPVLGPNLSLGVEGVSLGPNAPTSALMVSYSIIHNITRNFSLGYRRPPIRYECTVPDPFDSEKKPMEFPNLIYFQGKYFSTSLQGALVVMQLIDKRLTITAVGPTRAVPSSDSRFFREYLFVMDGEIMLVFLIYERYLAVVDRVEVFRLDLDKLVWIKVERLRRKLFLNDWCFLGDSEGIGGGRVYFSQGVLEKSWRVWDMESCCILPYNDEYNMYPFNPKRNMHMAHAS